MPELWLPASGTRTVVTPALMNWPESLPQFTTIGISWRLTSSPPITTSCDGASDTSLTAMRAAGQLLRRGLQRLGEQARVAQQVADDPQLLVLDPLEDHRRVALLGLELAEHTGQLQVHADRPLHAQQLVRRPFFEPSQERPQVLCHPLGPPSGLGVPGVLDHRLAVSPAGIPGVSSRSMERW